MKNWILIVLLAGLPSLCFSETYFIPSNAPPMVQLAWDASSDTNYGVLTYKLYSGPASRLYTNAVSCGTNLTAVLNNLVRGSTYYFAVTANATNGLESEWSNEVSWRPNLPPAPPIMKSLIVLTVQSKPTVTNAWAEAGMDWSIPPDHSSDLFRLKIVRLPQVAAIPTMKAKPKLVVPPIPGI